MTLARRVSKVDVRARSSSSTPTCYPQTIAVVQTRAEPLGIEVVVARPSHATGCPTATVLRRAGAVPGRDRAVRDLRGRDRRRRTSAARSSRSPPTCSRSRCSSRRASWAPTSPSARRSASACRWASAARTPGSWRCATGSSASCPAGWSASSSTPTAHRRTGSRCRPASSTSAARRRPATSAPRRCCSPSSPAMYAVYHGPDGLRAIAGGCTRYAAAARRRARAPAASRSCTTTFFDTVHGAACRAAPTTSSPPRRERGINLRLVDADHGRHQRRRDDDRASTSRAVWPAFGVADVDADASTTARRLPPTALRARRRRTSPHPVFHDAPLRDRDAALPAPARPTTTSRSTAR